MPDLPLTKIVTISGTVASGASISGEVDLGGAWNKVYLENRAPGAAVWLYGANASGGTYYRLARSNTSTAEVFAIGSATSGGLVPVDLAGVRYVKVAVTATAANGASFAFICS